MTYGSISPSHTYVARTSVEVEAGGAFFILFPEEHKRFQAGEAINKYTESAHGEFVITLQMQRRPS